MTTATSGEGWWTETENITKLIGEILGFVVGLVTLLTGAGFLIVNIYLSRYTNIHGFDINVSQYLAAGVGLLIVILAAGFIALVSTSVLKYIVVTRTNKTKRIQQQAYGFFLLFATLTLISVMLVFFTSLLVPQSSQAKAFIIIELPSVFLTLLVAFLRAYPGTIRRISGYLRVTLFIILVLVGIYLYENNIYGILPHHLGGGSPEAIVLADTSNAQLLYLSPDPNENKHTRVVLLLAELTDGLLVADTNNGRVIAIKDDQIAGRTSEATLQWVITPTPTLSATETLTPAAAATATT